MSKKNTSPVEEKPFEFDPIAFEQELTELHVKQCEVRDQAQANIEHTGRLLQQIRLFNISNRLKQREQL